MEKTKLNKRLDITLDERTRRTLESIADREQRTISQMAHILIQQAINQSNQHQVSIVGRDLPPIAG